MFKKGKKVESLTVSHIQKTLKCSLQPYTTLYVRKNLDLRGRLLFQILNACQKICIILESVTHKVTVGFNYKMEQNDDEDTTKFTRLLKKFIVTQHVSSPTHRCGGTLDLVLTAGGISNILQNLQIGIDTNREVFDHYPIMADLTIEAEKVPLRL